MSALKTAALREDGEAAASHSWMAPFTDNNTNPMVLETQDSPSSKGGIRRPRLKAAVAANVNEVRVGGELGLILYRGLLTLTSACLLYTSPSPRDS